MYIANDQNGALLEVSEMVWSRTMEACRSCMKNLSTVAWIVDADVNNF